MSISDDIYACASALGTLAGNVTEAQWEYLRKLRDNLHAQAERVANIEKTFIPLDAEEVA